jgi:hypothetical protein
VVAGDARKQRPRGVAESSAGSRIASDPTAPSRKIVY